MSLETPQIESGKLGKIVIDGDQVVETTGWTRNVKASIHTVGTSGSNGWKRAVAGTRHATGTLKGVMDIQTPIDTIIAAGDRVELKLYYDDTNYYRHAAILGNIETTQDSNEGDIVPWTCSWENDGDPDND